MCMVHHSKETWQAVPLWGNQGFYFWTMMLEKKAAECPLDCKEIKPVNLKGNQAWNFIGRTDAEDEIAIILPPDVENWLIGKYPEAGKDWRQEEKGTTGWDGWMASLTRWTWVWVNSGSWWWIGRPGVLQSIGSQSRTRLSDWTELMLVGELIAIVNGVLFCGFDTYLLSFFVYSLI